MKAMSLEKAEALLAKYRKQQMFREFSDFRIARFQRNFTFTFAISSVFFIFHDALPAFAKMPFVAWMALISGLVLGGCMTYFCIRWLSVCALFENAAPQNLSDLAVSSLTTDH